MADADKSMISIERGADGYTIVASKLSERQARRMEEAFYNRGKAARGKEPLPIPEEEPLRTAVAGFVEHRKKTLRKPLTARALELALRKVRGWHPHDAERQAALFDCAVEHTWQGIYWPKEWGPEPGTRTGEPPLPEVDE